MKIDNNFLALEEVSHKVPMSKKTRKWAIAKMEQYIQLSNFNGRHCNSKDIVNVNLAKGIIDEKDFEYVTNPYGLQNKKYPADILNFNLIKGKKRVLTGEERNRPFKYSVISTGDSSFSERQMLHKEMLVSNLEKMLINLQQKHGQREVPIDQTTGQPMVQEFKTPEEIEEAMRMEMPQLTEIKRQRSLRYIERSCNLRELFNEGMDVFLDTNKEVYSVENVYGEVTIRKVNTFYFDCILKPDSPWVEDGEAAIELRLMNPSDVYDEFHKEIAEVEGTLEEIESHRQGMNYGGGGFNTPGTEAAPYIQYVSATNMMSDYDTGGLVPVVRVVFKTLDKIGYLTYVDEFGFVQEDIVDEDFKVTEKAVYDENDKLIAGQEVKWDWINALYEGTRIGADKYLRLRPLKSHYESIDNPSICKLPYVGYYSNDPSLVEDAKPYQYFYFVLLWRLQNAFASDHGKVLLMDITQIPSEMGWDTKRWLYYLDAMKIAFINPYSEGRVKRRGKASSFNQFKELDLTLGNQIQSYIAALDKIEMMLSRMTGITDQRMGNIASTETVGGIERSVTQSTYITEYYFAIHLEVKRRVMAASLEVSRQAWSNGKKFDYIDNEIGRLVFELTRDELTGNNYDLWVTTDPADFNKLERYRAMTEAFANSNKALLSDIGEILRADTMAELDSKIKKSEEKQRRQVEQDNQLNRESAERIEQSRSQLENRKLDVQEANNIRDNEIALENNIRDNEVKLLLSSGEEHEEFEEDNSEDERIKREKLKQDNIHFNKQLKEKQLDRKDKMKIHKDKVVLEREKIKKMSINKSATRKK